MVDLGVRSPWFRLHTSRLVGRYIVTDKPRHFHRDVTCKQIRYHPDLFETDIITQQDMYFKPGSYQTLDPCTDCHPLTSKPWGVKPLGTTDIVCLGRDDEFVKAFRVRGKHRPPEWIAPVQLECLECPALDACYAAALEERPEYGVMGGVRLNQIEAWGDDAINKVRELANIEDTQEDQPATTTGPGKRGERHYRGSGYLEGVVA